MKIYRVRDSEYAGDGTFTDMDNESAWVHHDVYINALDEDHASLIFHEIYESDLPDCYDVQQMADLTLGIMANLVDPVPGIYH